MYEFPGQEQLVRVSDQFTVGTSLLVAPVLVQNATTRAVVLPGLHAGTTLELQNQPSPSWFVFNSTKTHAGEQNLTLSGLTLRDFPLFVRGGSILPLAPVGAQYVAESQSIGPLEVHIYSGANARFVLVEDDGETTLYATATTVR
jgi:alpha-glucosidase (family GH31 glycosyl hydrolase)